MSNTEIEDVDGIAIVGMAGRFPGARNIDEFWRNLRNGVEAISSFTEEELRSAGVDSALLNDPSYVRANATIEDTELFDASFFSIEEPKKKISHKYSSAGDIGLQIMFILPDRGAWPQEVKIILLPCLPHQRPIRSQHLRFLQSHPAGA